MWHFSLFQNSFVVRSQAAWFLFLICVGQNSRASSSDDALRATTDLVARFCLLWVLSEPQKYLCCVLNSNRKKFSRSRKISGVGMSILAEQLKWKVTTFHISLGKVHPRLTLCEILHLLDLLFAPCELWFAGEVTRKKSITYMTVGLAWKNMLCDFPKEQPVKLGPSVERWYTFLLRYFPF